MSTLIKNWQKAKNSVNTAEQWNSLPNGRKYENSSFKISEPHCKLPTFTRAGQQVCAGKNYWETDEAFGNALMKYLINDWDKHFAGVMAILKEDEKQALLKCQSYVDEMQAAIDEA